MVFRATLNYVFSRNYPFLMWCECGSIAMLNRHTMTLAGAIEEILLQHRGLIDDVVRSLEESTPSNAIVDAFHARVAEAQLQEPSCWELRVVEFIHRVVAREMISNLRDRSGMTNQDGVERAKTEVGERLASELGRLLELANRRAHQQHAEHDYLDSFWRDVAYCVEASSGNLLTDGFEDKDKDKTVYEVITFDGHENEIGSADSSPCLEELPIILSSLASASKDIRDAALSRLSQISTLEVVHSSMFRQTVDELCSLLLHDDMEVERSSVRILYNVINEVEEPCQFLDMYLIIVDRIGTALSEKNSTLYPMQRENEDGNATTDVIRFLHLVVCRAPYHWIHFPSDKLALMICATIVLLLLDPLPEKKACRLLDLFGVIDPEAKWFSKWVTKVPSRPQLLTSLEETGFLAQLMYEMTRVRPLDAGIEAHERYRIGNMIVILGLVAQFEQGRDELFRWTKLPAHLHNQHRYSEWRGLDQQFRLNPIQRENDKMYQFRRFDQKVGADHGLELEDGGPLGEQAMEALIVSAIMLFVFDDSKRDRLLFCVKNTSHGIAYLPSKERIMASLIEFTMECKSGSPCVGGGDCELEERDPWFPFRRPKEITEVVKFAKDASRRRELHQSALFVRRCYQTLGVLIEESAKLPPRTVPFASVLSNALCEYLDKLSHSESSDAEIEHSYASVFTSLQTSLAKSPYTLGTALSRDFHRIGAKLYQQLECKSVKCQDALISLLLTMTQCSALLPKLLESGLWYACKSCLFAEFKVSDSIDLRTLYLLCLPEVAESFLASELVQTTLQHVLESCGSNLDMAVGINSPLTEAPFRLRQLFRNTSAIRAALATYGVAGLYSRSSIPFMEFLARSVICHKNGECLANSQSEDLCAMIFDWISAATGCISAMIGVYALFAHYDAHIFNQNESVSACSYLAASVYSSQLHVGGQPTDWVRPRQLHNYPEQSIESPETAASRRNSGSTKAFEFSTITKCTIDQMILSIDDSRARGDALDMVMLSQATWEVIADVERKTCRQPQCYRVLTRALGDLIFSLVQSGQSKIGEGKLSPSPAIVTNSFPTDAERKLMNTYYKDYCSRLGLEVSPTMLHMTTKVFGGAATDCFSVTMLMILGQNHSEQEIIDTLQYCAGCPSIYVLWPRIGEDDSGIPTLRSLAAAAEMILEAEFPQIFATLRSCYCSVLALVLRWHSQCYWNHLTWDNILLMVYLNFLYGTEVQVYVFVAIVKHLEPTMRKLLSRNRGDPGRAFTDILQAPIEGFRFHTARSLILTLRSTYHDHVQNILRQ